MAEPVSTHSPEDCASLPLHCWIHGTDTEPLKGYRYCLECGHMFAAPEELLEAHNAVLAEMDLPPDADARQVHICPHCTHDL